MSAVLTTHEATVHTMAVHISVLKVGPKQVTMGMFRQLPYEQVWNSMALLERLGGCEVPILAGPIWGTVNYWWADAHSEDDTYTNDVGQWVKHGDRRHVVWQSADTLRRAIVCEDVPYWLLQQHRAQSEALKALWRPIWQDIIALPQLFIAV